mmetsp:Transcript_70554/g.147761  ORF Transcript_70554/g.147761 Transcript_70554/m.147761 type:complete len:649 (-) Transcript_70554:55-2001(-)
MRRVKNVGYDADEWGDWDDGGWGGGGGAKPKAKGAAAKGKAAAKASTAPKAAAKGAAAAPPKAAAPAVKPAAIEELVVALSRSSAVDSAAAEAALTAAKGKPEDAFLALLAAEMDAGRWQPRATSSSASPSGPPAPDEDSAKAKAKSSAASGSSSAAAAASSSATDAAAAKSSKSKSDFKPDARKAAESASAPSASAAASKEVEEDDADDPPAAPAADDKVDSRPNISLVVIGHVDAGKSTLMGHLLCLVGNVSSKQMHKFEKESKQIGKASFAFAWVLDEGEDERERGVTIDVCVKHFETKSRLFTILDAPGHRDFVPNMLQGAVQADVALVVVDVSHFEAGFERGGQTKEHLQLARSLGISQLVVAVNKLDTCGWDQNVFETIKGKLHAFIVGPECGFKESVVSYIPLSGFSGENMLESKEEALKAWWQGPTLIESLDTLKPPPRAPADGPLRVCISDLYKSGATSCLSGKVESGTISTGQKVLLLPSGEQTQVKSLQCRSDAVRTARPGDYLDSLALPVELQFASIGGGVCDIKRPIPCVDTFQAQLLVFDVDIPIMRGQQVMCYLHTETVTATISRLEKLIIKGKPQDKRPKCLQKGNVAIVSLQASKKVCVEPKSASGPVTSLSRLILRDRGSTIAAGVVLSV